MRMITKTTMDATMARATYQRFFRVPIGSTEEKPLKSMCPSTAMTKPVVGARTRTRRLRDLSPRARPIPVMLVNRGWPKEVYTPRSMTISMTACFGSPAAAVTRA